MEEASAPRSKKFPARSRSPVGNMRHTGRQRLFRSVPISIVCPLRAVGHRREVPPWGPLPGGKPRASHRYSTQALQGLHTRERGCAAVTPHTTTTRPRGRIRRKLVGLPALFLLATVLGTASLAGLAGASSAPAAKTKFDAATWK